MAKFTLYVVRHGQTYFNIFNKLQGWSNSPLTQAGLDGARKTGKRLADIDFKASYCSDTSRAQKTISIILIKIKLLILELRLFRLFSANNFMVILKA